MSVTWSARGEAAAQRLRGEKTGLYSQAESPASDRLRRARNIGGRRASGKGEIPVLYAVEMLSVSDLLELIAAYKYAAMFFILVFSAMGVPIPDDVTLVASGVSVGLEWASFWPTCGACLLGVVVGDVYVYYLGRRLGPGVARTRFSRALVRPKLAAKVQASFARHGGKTVLIGRLIPMVRFLIFFYAGQRRMGLWRFIALDLPGVFLQSPLTILAGVWAGRQLPDADAAADLASGWVREGYFWLYLALAVTGAVVFVVWLRRRQRRSGGSSRDASPPHGSDRRPDE